MISLDTETTGVDLYHGARPFFVTAARDSGEVLFWEWDVDPGTREVAAPEEDAEEIRLLLSGEDEIILQNSKFDAAALLVSGIVDWGPLWERTQDTLLAGHLLASNQPHDLTSMVRHYVGLDISEFEEALRVECLKAKRAARTRGWRVARSGDAQMPSIRGQSWRADTWLPRALALRDGLPRNHPWWHVLGDYSNADSVSTLALWRVQRRELEARGLWRIYEERRRLLPVVFGMERRGVTMSGWERTRLRERFVRESAGLGDRCVEIAGRHEYGLQLPKSGKNRNLEEFVFEVLDLPKIRNPRGKTDAPMLDSKVAIPHYLATLDPESSGHEFIRSLAEKRRLDTAVAALDSYERYWLPLGEGWFVVRPRLNPTGTSTLRMSSSDPNSQSVGKREVDRGEGASVRECFGPVPGREWWSLDYDNIELRIPAYESGEEAMIELFERPDEPPYFGSQHLLNASIIYPDEFWPLAEARGAFKERYATSLYGWTKNFGFALSYQASAATADRAARRPGACDLVRGRLKRHSELNEKYVRMADRLGYVETLPDRTVDPSRGYPVMCSRSEYGRVKPTIPLNYHVQSTAMWCTSKAMVRCQAQLDRWNRDEPGRDYRMVLQVHDEIVFDFPRGGRRSLGKVARLRMLMEESGSDVGVPLKVSVSYHPRSWGRHEEPRR